MRLRVLATAGTPPDFADLGQALAVCQVRRLPGGPRAVVTLAAAADGRRLTADQLVVALAAALDWLDGWRPGEPDALDAAGAAPAARRPASPTTPCAGCPPRSPAPPPPSAPPTAQPPGPSVDAPADAPADDPLGLSGA